jgi:hypothetical protein
MTVEIMREDLLLRMIEMNFPKFLAQGMANKVYTLARWDGTKN